MQQSEIAYMGFCDGTCVRFQNDIEQHNACYNKARPELKA